MNVIKSVCFTALFFGFTCAAQAAINLKLSHNQNRDIPVHRAMEHFAQKLNEYTDGEVRVRIYPNAQLGTQRESVELVQAGGLALAKTNAAELEAFEPLYGVFNLPYLFRDEDHYYEVLLGDIGEEVLNASLDKGFIGITYYDAGARSFYADKPIRHPDDLQGMKVRVQPSPSAVRMVELLGASPTPIAFSELYTALQQGVVDGAENNESALIDNRHGEVSKFYSYDRHTMIPDVLVMSLRDWNRLSETQQQALKKAARESMLLQRELWQENTEKVIREARDSLGVHFIEDVDVDAFAEKVRPMYVEKMQSSEKARDLIERIQALSEE